MPPLPFMLFTSELHQTLWTMYCMRPRETCNPSFTEKPRMSRELFTRVTKSHKRCKVTHTPDTGSDDSGQSNTQNDTHCKSISISDKDHLQQWPSTYRACMKLYQRFTRPWYVCIMLFYENIQAATVFRGLPLWEKGIQCILAHIRQSRMAQG